MNYLHTTTTDPYAFSLWPEDSATSEEEMAMWAQPAGYAQPGFTLENYPLDVLDATFAWGQGGTTPAEISDFQNNSDIDWMSRGAVAANMSSHGVPFPNATVVGALAPVTSPFSNANTDTYPQGFFSSQPDFSNGGTPSMTSDSSPSPQSDGPLDSFLESPNPEAAPSSFVQQQGLSFPLDTAGALDPNQLTCTPPWFMGDSNLAGQVQSGFDPLFDIMNDIAYSATWDFTLPTGYLAPPTEALTTMVTLEAGPSTSLGKRSRPSDNDESGCPKKGRPNATRVPGDAESSKKTRRSPATRTRKTINGISKAVGRGAERLVSTTAQGIYHRSFPGLSVPQGSVGVLEPEQPSWIVGREQVETRHDTVPQQITLPSVENAEDEEDLHRIPKKLSERERMMLQKTQAEEERGAVRVIKCKLCPKARFRTWVIYQRHCNFCERHPSSLVYCSKCGDYFARKDSILRHGEKRYQEACHSTSEYDASQKKEKVERYLEVFEAKLKQCLKNGEKIGSFSKEMTEELKNTSKKAFKTEEIPLEGEPWAAGLC